MDWQRWNVVEVDVDMSNANEAMCILASALFERPVERVDHLTSGEFLELAECIRNIPDFWETAVTPKPWTIQTNAMFHVRRVRTKGKPVLEQTIAWLRKHYGLRNPVVWCEEI